MAKTGTLRKLLKTGVERSKDALDADSTSRKAKKKIKKNLEPIWIQQTDDPNFNNEVAAKVFSLVAKMDDDEAEMFSYFVGCEMLDEDITKNLRTLQRHLDDVVAKRLAAVKNAVFSVAKRDGMDADAVAYAQAVFELEEITKKDPTKKKKARGVARNQYDYNHDFQETDVRRNQMGQFTTKIKVNPNASPWKNQQLEAMGHGKAADNLKSMKGLTDSQKSQYQQEYLQLANFLQTFQASGGDPADHVILHVKNKSSGVVSSIPSNEGTSVPGRMWNPKREQLVGVEARPSQLKMGQASYNIAQGLGAGTQGASDAAFYGERLDQNIKPFAENWTKPGAEDYLNTNAQTYRRVQAGSQFVGAVARPGTAVHSAARLAEFAGTHGPEAEAVFGPAARKTAYRYRGTEKTPDPHIVELYRRAIDYTKLNAPSTGPEPVLPGRRPIPGEAPAPVQQAARRAAAMDRVPTWTERDAGRQVIMQQLAFRIPNRQLFGLQLASGHTPPSEGILLNADGQIVTQAVGYGDDHYLPFNLKNLKALKGGEYIRTRSVGGLTSEDIYTGLLSGARQVTVISRSGTFTVTFDETLRGGRRYNDKAMRMTDRYEHLLDALESEQVDAKPVPDNIRDTIQSEIDRDYSGWSPGEQKKMFDQKVEEYKSYGSALTKEDKAYIDARVALLTQQDPTADEREIRQTLVQDQMADKEFKFRLNGEGYASALKALEEQFPYYLTVRSAPFREPDLPEPEKDRGYVMPRHNRPGAAKHGYYNTRIAGQGQLNYLSGPLTGQVSGKIQASDADYQNRAYASSKTLGLSEEEAKEKATAATTSSTSGSGVSVDLPGTPEKKAQREKKETLAERRDQNNFGEAAWALLRARPAPTEWAKRAGNQAAAMAARDDRQAFDELVSTEAGRAEVSRMIRSEDKGNFARARKEYVAFIRASSQIDRKVLSKDAAFNWQDRPMKVAGDAFKKTADQAHATKVLNDLDAHSRSITSTKRHAEMDEDEKQREIKALKQLEEDRDLLKGTAEEEKEAFAEFGVMNPKNAAFLLNNKNKDAIREQAMNLHKVRLIQANLKRQADKAAGVTSEAADVDYDPAKLAEEIKADNEARAGGPIRRTGAPDEVAPAERRKAINDYIEIIDRHRKDMMPLQPRPSARLTTQIEELKLARDELDRDPLAVTPQKQEELIMAAKMMTDEKDPAVIGEMEPVYVFGD